MYICIFFICILIQNKMATPGQLFVNSMRCRFDGSKFYQGHML